MVTFLKTKIQLFSKPLYESHPQKETSLIFRSKRVSSLGANEFHLQEQTRLIFRRKRIFQRQTRLLFFDNSVSKRSFLLQRYSFEIFYLFFTRFSYSNELQRASLETSFSRDDSIYSIKSARSRQKMQSSECNGRVHEELVMTSPSAAYEVMQQQTISAA